MEKYKVKIEPDALLDIQGITDWYNNQQDGLGKRFQNSTIIQIDSLSINPHGFVLRYKQVRCSKVKGFPYMIHFYINEENRVVEVLAVSVQVVIQRYGQKRFLKHSMK